MMRHVNSYVAVHTRRFESIRITAIHGDSESMIGLDLFCRQSRRVSQAGSIMNVELLISLVQERPAIYDPSHPMHHNRDVIAAAWKDIATEMKCKGKFVFICQLGLYYYSRNDMYCTKL